MEILSFPQDRLEVATERGMRLLLEDKDKILVMVGAVYGSFDVETGARRAGDEIEDAIKALMTSAGWQDALVKLLRPCVGNFSVMVLERGTQTLTAVNSLQIQLFYIFDGERLVVSTDQRHVFEKSKGTLNEDDALIYVMMSEEGVRSTFLSDCHRLPCGTVSVLDCRAQQLTSSECTYYQHVWDRLQAGAKFTAFGDIMNEVGGIYGKKLAGKKIVATMSGVDAADAAISLLNAGLSMDALVSDNYAHQTSVSKSMWEDISAAFPSRCGPLHVVGCKDYDEDNGPDFVQKLEEIYLHSVYMDHSNFHITEGFCSAMEKGIVAFGGQLIGTGRAGFLNHTSLYKASWYKSHMFGFRDRLVYTLDYMKLARLWNPRCYEDILDASSYPGTSCDSDYREIRKHRHESLYHSACEAYKKCVLRELRVDVPPQDAHRQLYNIQYFEVKQKLMQGVITTTEAWSRRYGISGMQLLSDGPGMHTLLECYNKRWWHALFPKQVVYDYFKRMTGRSFTSTAVKARRYCAEEDTHGFLPKSPLRSLHPGYWAKRLNKKYWGRRFAKIQRSIMKRLPGGARKVEEMGVLAPLERRHEEKKRLECPSFYMPLLWEKYREKFDMRRQVHNKDFLAHLNGLVERIESGKHSQDGQLDRFLNLNIFLSKYLK